MHLVFIIIKQRSGHNILPYLSPSRTQIKLLSFFCLGRFFPDPLRLSPRSLLSFVWICFWSPPIHLSRTSLSNLQTLPIRIAGIFPWAAYLPMVISWSLRYSDTSFVVMILAKVESPGGKPFSFVKLWDGVFSWILLKLTKINPK